MVAYDYLLGSYTWSGIQLSPWAMDPKGRGTTKGSHDPFIILTLLPLTMILPHRPDCCSGSDSLALVLCSGPLALALWPWLSGFGPGSRIRFAFIMSWGEWMRCASAVALIVCVLLPDWAYRSQDGSLPWLECYAASASGLITSWIVCGSRLRL